MGALHVFIGFIILIVSIFMVINAGWPVLLIPLLMVSFFVYVVLTDTLIYKKRRGKGGDRQAGKKPDGDLAAGCGPDSSDSSEDSADSGGAEDAESLDSGDDYSGDGGDFGGGGASGSWD